MRLSLLGTGGALTNERRQNTSFALEHEPPMLIDCSGNPPVAMQRARIDWTNLQTVVLTHRHPDHVYGLPALVQQLAIATGAAGRRPLRVYGLEETLEIAGELLRTLRLTDEKIGFPVELHTLPPRVHHVAIAGLSLTTFPVEHGEIDALGLRVQPPGVPARGFVCSGDTGLCQAVIEQSRGVRLLLHECSIIDGAPVEQHTSLEDIEALVSHSSAQKIVLVHLPPLTVEAEAALRDELIQRWGDRVVLGTDGQEFEL